MIECINIINNIKTSNLNKLKAMLVIAKENMMSAIIEKVSNEKIEEGISAC